MIVRGESEAEYRDNPAVSWSKLKVFEKSPALYKRRFIDKLSPPEVESDALLIGRAFHCLVLEGQGVFESRYAVAHTKINRTTTGGKAAWAELVAAGKEVLKAEQYALISEMANAIDSNADAAELLAVGEPEVAMRVIGGPLNRQGRLDWLNGKSVVDLKSIEDLDKFETDLQWRGYYRQAAWYVDLCETDYPGPFSFTFVAVEKSEPYRCGVYHIGTEYLEAGRIRNQRAFAALADAYRLNVWPGNPQTRVMSPPFELTDSLPL